ncbi:MAG: GntR family transcriptional regulator [Planctomycetes bacterium]|nr:GntR family transcriptional regulator [Planctomycetota bacterium]
MEKVRQITKCTQIKSVIEERINGMAPGEMLPSGPKLAAEYGVSRFTVSRAIAELEAEGKLFRKQGSGTYVQERESKKKSGRIGLVMGKSVAIEANNFFYNQVFQGIESAISANAYSMVLVKADDNEGDIETLRQAIIKDELEGLLLMGRVNLSAIEALMNKAEPFVIVDRNIAFNGVASVGTANVEGAKKITEHLIKLGHRKIGFITSVLHTSFSERLEGYRMALEEAGIEAKKEFIFTNFESYRNGDDLLDIAGRTYGPTAFVCANDGMAADAMSFLMKEGLRVPEDISFVGFDDEAASTRVCPQLTTMRIDKEGMGRKAAEMLFEYIREPERERRKLYMETELILRDSTAEPSKEE